MDTIKFPFDVISAYFSSPSMLCLFVVCLIYLWMCEKDKVNRRILVYITTAMLGVFIFPVVVYVATRTIFNVETYYRFLWMIPMYAVIAYSFTRLYGRFNNIFCKYAVLIVGVVIIAFSGNFIFDHPTFVRAENVYHVPQTLVDICDVIEKDSEKKDFARVVMPREFLETTRQYTARIRMPYGRNVMIENWQYYHPLYEAYMEDVIDVKKITELCISSEHRCSYIVVNRDKKIDGDFEDYSFEHLASVDDYDIYCNKFLRDIIYW